MAVPAVPFWLSQAQDEFKKPRPGYISDALAAAKIPAPRWCSELAGKSDRQNLLSNGALLGGGDGYAPNGWTLVPMVSSVYVAGTPYGSYKCNTSTPSNKGYFFQDVTLDPGTYCLSAFVTWIGGGGNLAGAKSLDVTGQSGAINQANNKDSNTCSAGSRPYLVFNVAARAGVRIYFSALLPVDSTNSGAANATVGGIMLNVGSAPLPFSNT